MKKFILSAAFVTAFATEMMAGGLLTNTNQSISFLRNPAREAAIGIDGVYSNPAGVAFLGEGFHLGFGWQYATQTREITTTSPLFGLNTVDPSLTKKFKGEAIAPFIPSIQAAYNTGKWSFMFNFAVHGGGGKCEFANGIGTFDNALGQIAGGLKSFGATGYSASSFMEGNQYYFGFTVGAAYKVNDHLSVYGGLRALYGTASYKARISDIKVATAGGNVPFGTFLGAAQVKVSDGLSMLEPNMPAINAGIATLEQAAAAMGGVQNLPAEMKAQYAALVENRETYNALVGAQPTLNGLEKYSEGVNLQSDQSGFGIAPIIGVDYKIGNFNFAGKYEFRTKMSLKNESTLNEAGILEPLKKFEDGRSIREDNPAMLALGVQWSALPNLRINAGYHYFYDEESVKYNDDQKNLDGGTNEYLGGVEYDVCDKLTVSGGFQITKYGLTDAFMNDMSFVVNSWSFGLGVKYQVSEKIAVEAAYFQTNYDNYKTQPDAAKITNDFTRTNKVFGAGVTFDF